MPVGKPGVELTDREKYQLIHCGLAEREGLSPRQPCPAKKPGK
jgi:hypothetical protein